MPTNSFLIINPHPDDAELGMGGIIAKLGSKGNSRIYIVDLTNGEPTPFGTPMKRKKEAEKAASILGLDERVTLNFPNRYLRDSDEVRLELAKYIRRFKPDIMFIPYFEDAHPDHIAASIIAENARFFAKFTRIDLPYKPWYTPRVLYYFCTHLRIVHQISFSIDISRFFDKKIKSIKAYRSQFIDNPNNRVVINYIKDLNRFWGSLINVEYGEALYSREIIKINDLVSML